MPKAPALAHESPLSRPESRWLQILRTMPVLPEIPVIADWLKAQKLETTADQTPTCAG